PVFEGSTLVAVAGHHVHTPPERPSSALGEAVPTELEDIVLACLAKRPDARPADARDLRARLEATRLATAWTAERAGSFWEARARSLPPARPSGPQTIALDVTGRAAG
ncbi:MAG TPA: hypothetical protein VGK73_21780, partial [Polyangiaceae bacterium]